MGWDTAANILNDAAVELGLLSSDLANPYDSNDANIIQLRRLLKSLGQQLVGEHPWSHLQKEHTFATVADTVGYALPADFDRTLNQTHWNRTEQLPLGGPLSAQGWQLLQAQSTAGVVDVYFRTVNNEVQLYPTPSGGATIAYEYVSQYWVQPAAESTATSSEPMAGTDALHFDRRILVAGLKSRFQRAKGFDSSASDEEFRDALARAKGADGAAPVLSLNHRGPRIGRLLDGANIPETGFGS